MEELGAGGMGVVYRALHVELERSVAIKVMRADRVGDTQAVERFRREIKAAGKLEHPNIVLAYDARQIGGKHILVMEFIEGLDFAQLLERVGPLPIADACEAVRQAALGLQHAHEHQLVHRDIKPSNLMLARNGAVKILDLGLARLQSVEKASQGTTGAGFVVGTPDYMAPEQASGDREVNARSDIYSLGCTLHAFLAGEPPFSGPSHQQAYEKMMAHVHELPVSVQEIRPQVPISLRAILERMLAKEPNERHASAADVADALAESAPGSDLAGLLATAIGRPATKRISAIETPRASQTPKSWPVWLLSGACLLALLGVLFWIIWGADNDAPITEPSTTPTPAVAVHDATGLPGWIVLSWTLRGIGKPDLWLFRPDGAERLQVTNSPRSFDVHPSFSPDGRRIAFVRGSELEGSTALWVCQSNGTNARELIGPGANGERVMSPVWRSDSKILYVRDPHLDRMPDMDLWQVNLEDGENQLVFPLRHTMVGGIGMATDISPEGDRLAILLQRRGFWPMANVYTTDLEDATTESIWQDIPDECKDARALWSPDGKHVAWHHNFTRGGLSDRYYYGVGMAAKSDSGDWEPRLQSEPDTRITPIAWAPNGSGLLCARMTEDETRATLVLIDVNLQEKTTLFELDVDSWLPGKQDLGRLGDWAVVPADVLIQPQ